MPILRYMDHTPWIADDAFVAASAYVIGDVTIGPESSVWYGSVLRGDMGSITLGRGVNIQDHSTVHNDPGLPVVLGDYVSLGHNAIVHSAIIEDRVLVAIAATILTGARIGAGSIIAANALVPEGREIPPRSLVVGTPGKVLREITDAEYDRIVETYTEYLRLGREYIELGHNTR